MQSVLKELLWREAGTGEGDAAAAAPREVEEGQLQIQEVQGRQHLEEALEGQIQGTTESLGGKGQGEDPTVTVPSNFFRFNQTLVVKAGNGNVNKFLHIDESVCGNMIQVKGQHLLVVPDYINTEVPDSTGQKVLPRGVEELQDSRNIVKRSKKFKKQKKFIIFKNVKGLSTSSLRRKGPSGMLGSKTNMPLVIRQ